MTTQQQIFLNLKKKGIDVQNGTLKSFIYLVSEQGQIKGEAPIFMGDFDEKASLLKRVSEKLSEKGVLTNTFDGKTSSSFFQMNREARELSPESIDDGEACFMMGHLHLLIGLLFEKNGDFFKHFKVSIENNLKSA